MPPVGCNGRRKHPNKIRICLRFDLKYDAAGTDAAVEGRPKNIAARIHYDRRIGVGSVVASGETVQHAFVPRAFGGWRQLIDYTAANRRARIAVHASVGCGAVEIAGAVEREALLRLGTIAVDPDEVVEDGLVPEARRDGRQLIGKANVVAAARIGGAVKVSFRVKDHAA